MSPATTYTGHCQGYSYFLFLLCSCFLINCLPNLLPKGCGVGKGATPVYLYRSRMATLLTSIKEHNTQRVTDCCKKKQVNLLNDINQYNHIHKYAHIGSVSIKQFIICKVSDGMQNHVIIFQTGQHIQLLWFSWRCVLPPPTPPAGSTGLRGRRPSELR